MKIISVEAGSSPSDRSKGMSNCEFRESRNQQGHLTYLGGAARRRTIAEMPVYDVELDFVITLGTEL